MSWEGIQLCMLGVPNGSHAYAVKSPYFGKQLRIPRVHMSTPRIPGWVDSAGLLSLTNLNKGYFG